MLRFRPASSSGGAGQQSFKWQVQTYNSLLSVSHIYFFWLNPGPNGFPSHYFNITDPAPSTSSVVSSAVSSTSATLTSSTSAASITISPTPSAPIQQVSNATPAQSPSASTGTETLKVGLGVGLGLGIPLVLIAGIWVGYKCFKQNQSSSQEVAAGMQSSQYTDKGHPPDPYLNAQQIVDYQQPNVIHEIPVPQHLEHEVAGDRPLIELGHNES